MPSTPTSRNRLEKQGSGENSNTWGTKLNTTGLDLLDEAIDGVETIALTVSPTTLTTTNFASDQQRNKAYRFTGTGAFTVTIPASEQVKLFINATTGTLTVSNGTNSTTIGAGKSYWIASDGTNLFKDNTAEAAAAAAETSATNAANSATTASGHASTAETHKNSAASHASTAETHKNSAATSATNAANSETAAAGHVTTASNWAQKTDGTVDGTGFSAKYWAGQAATSSGIPTVSGNAGKFLTNDGTSTNWGTVASISSANIQDFDASGTWTKPTGAKIVEVIIWGAGSGAGGGATNAGSAGGTGGAYHRVIFLASDLGATETVTIGSGGIGGNSSGSSPTAGGNSSFGSHITPMVARSPRERRMERLGSSPAVMEGCLILAPRTQEAAMFGQAA